MRVCHSGHGVDRVIESRRLQWLPQAVPQHHLRTASNRCLARGEFTVACFFMSSLIVIDFLGFCGVGGVAQWLECRSLTGELSLIYG